MKCKITVDEDLCLGCGACASSYDQYMEMDEESGKAKPKKSSYPSVPDDLEGVCPAGAISIQKEK